jgi:molecular chaperone DnaJ
LGSLRKKQVGFGCGVLELFLQVITVEGLMDLQVPAGTQPGDILVMHKLGMPKLNKPSSRGDHFFTIKVTIPIQLRYEVFVKLLYKTISAKHMEP